MEQFNLPLLGSEYEELEFDLEITEDRIKGLDSYIYVGKKFNNFLNYPTDKIEVIFNFDRLYAVILFLHSNENSKKIEKLINKLEYFKTQINSQYILIYAEEQDIIYRINLSLLS